MEAIGANLGAGISSLEVAAPEPGVGQVASGAKSRQRAMGAQLAWLPLRQPDRWDKMLGVVRLALHGDPALRGIAWLLHELRLVDAFRFSRHNSIINDELLNEILSRCYASDSMEQRRDACFALGALLGWQ